MEWNEVREIHPDQWLIIEAIETHTDDQQRFLDKIAVVERCPDGAAAMKRYRQLHQVHPLREFYFIHTSRKEIDILERHWAGVQRAEIQTC